MVTGSVNSREVVKKSPGAKKTSNRPEQKE